MDEQALRLVEPTARREKTKGTGNEGLGEIAPHFQQVSFNNSLDWFSSARSLSVALGSNSFRILGSTLRDWRQGWRLLRHEKIFQKRLARSLGLDSSCGDELMQAHGIRCKSGTVALR
jgi:hypothetical protein